MREPIPDIIAAIVVNIARTPERFLLLITFFTASLALFLSVGLNFFPVSKRHKNDTKQCKQINKN